ncbi:unnamed protein product [Dovyalis caffra]|uniref:F-box domain-containing protein n=1 Tax=Dovyalis caffra TaxID=77055 RepID=A0AAV1SP38_9ROSI|nr:unnamed protein product [Dovyalis caffra]
MSIYVGEDMFREILLRLPPKSLLCFQTVCKNWLALITSSDFIAVHCQHQPKHSVVFPSWLECRIPKQENSCPPLRKSKEFGISILRYGKSRPDYLDIPSSMIKDTSSASLLGFCNGLLCINIVDIKAEVFTLSTGSWRDVKAIPRLGRDFRIYHKPVIVKGVWYCMALRLKNHRYMSSFILTFDMGNDSFSIMEDGVPDIDKLMVELITYNTILNLMY